MTAVTPLPTTAPATRSSAAEPRDPVDLRIWVLAADDRRVHALATPCPIGSLGVLPTRCGVWHPVACPVSVVGRGELCPRCAAGGVGLLELLPDRADVRAVSDLRPAAG